MDYEKKYKEALEKARQLCAYPTSKPFISDLQDIFPELKESEGEQHRKWILEYLYDGLRKSDEQFKDHFKAAIAWIEKQGEQIPNYCHHEVDLSECSEEYRKAYYDGWNNCNQQRAQLEAEKKPADKVEPKFKVGDKIRRKTTSSCDKDMQVARIEKDYYICNHIGKFSSEVVPFLKQSSYELIEQNPAETEKGAKGNDREIPNSAWSEEDEEHLERILKELESQRQRPFKRPYLDKIESDYNWLKSLKERYTWKPSDTEINILQGVIDGSFKSENVKVTLTNILEQLKKLREE